MPTPSPLPWRTLAILRLIYFWSFAGLGSLYPFLPLLLERHHLRPTEIAWVLMVTPLCGLVVPPLWGIAADALRARIPLLRIACWGCGLSVLGFGVRGGIWTYGLILGLFSLFRTALAPLLDATTITIVGTRQAKYAHIRVSGSLGFALFAGLVGWLGGSARPWTLLIASAACYLMAGTVGLALRAGPIGRRPGVSRDLRRVLSRTHFRLFLLGTVLHYLGHSIYDAYFGLHVRRLGYDDSLVGMSWAVGVVVEVGVMLLVPLLLYSRLRHLRLHQWYRLRHAHRELTRTEAPDAANANPPGHSPDATTAARWLLIASFASVIRWAGLAIATNSATLVGLQALHGLTFGLWYLGLVHYIQAEAPGDLRTSLQSAVFAGIGFGTLLGYLVGGWVLESHGGSWLFGLAALVALGALACYVPNARREPTPPDETWRLDSQQSGG